MQLWPTLRLIYALAKLQLNLNHLIVNEIKLDGGVNFVLRQTYLLFSLG